MQQDNPDNPARRIDPITGKEYPDIPFINKICADIDPMLQEAVTLTDTNTQTGVSIENGLFTRIVVAGYKDQVTIKFDVKPAVDASKVVGPIDSVTFQTTVQLR